MQYRNRYQINKNKIEKIKWITIIATLILILFYNYFYQNVSFLTRIFIICFLLIVLGFIFFSTKKGKFVLYLIYESRKESRKIIWPNFQETFYTTLIISIVTILTSILFWGLDSFLVYVISNITSLRFF